MVNGRSIAMKTKKLNWPHTAITRIKQLGQMNGLIENIANPLFDFYLDFDCTDTMKELDKSFSDGEIKSFDDFRKFFDNKSYELRKEAEQLMKSIV